MDSFDVTLRRLAVRDAGLGAGATGETAESPETPALDPKTQALVRISALVAVDASTQSYSPCVDAAHQHGATNEEIVGVLAATIPILGAPRAVSAAPKLALALGYDLDAALEEPLDITA